MKMRFILRVVWLLSLLVIGGGGRQLLRAGDYTISQEGGFCGGQGNNPCAAGLVCNYMFSLGTRNESGRCISASTITCNNLWWFDNTHYSCSQKQFCGSYTYSGLRTFNSQALCNEAIPRTTPATSLCSWCGTACVKATSDMACIQISPPEGKDCVEKDKVCTIVSTAIPTKSTCSPRPTCLDSEPRCMLAEPIGGWCQVSPTPQGGCFYKQVECIRAPCNPVLVCPSEVPTMGLNCQNLWWFDNTKKQCSQKQFCGAYMYLGLRTFATEADCLAGLGGAVVVGDADGNGMVDLVDFAIWKSEYLSVTPPLSLRADFNKSRRVDLVDFAIWKKAYLNITPTLKITSGPEATVIPTPMVIVEPEVTVAPTPTFQ
jgi:hypothetical protein